jgi:MFS family permease
MALRRDLLGYYWYEATSATTLYRPVMFLYFRALGFSWTQVAILEAVGSLVTVATGYVGDRVGRRTSPFAGTALIAVALRPGDRRDGRSRGNASR